MDIRRTARKVLTEAYGVPNPHMHRILAGLETMNFAVDSPARNRLFVKIYQSSADLSRANAAIGMSRWVGDAGIPTASPLADSTGAFIHIRRGIRLSVWSFVEGDAGDSVPLDMGRAKALGHVLGHMHRRLSAFPARGVPHRDSWCDLDRAHEAIERAIRRLEGATHLEAKVRECATGVLRWRLTQLPSIENLLTRLPRPTMQVVHGDCSPGNVIFRGTRVAALLDFQPPAVAPIWWELGRIGCSPSLVLHRGDWSDRLGHLLSAYRRQHEVPVEDLAAVPLAARCFMTASVTPFDDLADPHALLPARSIYRYALARHTVITTLWNRAEEHDQAVARIVSEF